MDVIMYTHNFYYIHQLTINNMYTVTFSHLFQNLSLWTQYVKLRSNIPLNTKARTTGKNTESCKVTTVNENHRVLLA